MIVVELFAGVGGFRLGLEGQKSSAGIFKSSLSGYSQEIHKSEHFITGYSNQWEPKEKGQFASRIYVEKFGSKGHENRNIEEVSASDIINIFNSSIPKDRIEEPLMLVGGFPCQDYSVANGLHTSKGILGKKGVLWWHIERILRELKSLKRQPEILILENVDRLLKSPANARGRDFALMLTCLENLGYVVEYRVLNAADYGFPQRRKRVFIVAYLKSSRLGLKTKNLKSQLDIESFFENDSVLGKSFPLKLLRKEKGFSIPLGSRKGLKNLERALIDVQESDFKGLSPFGNGGLLIDGLVTSFNITPLDAPKKSLVLKDILVPIEEVDHEFYVEDSDLKKWQEVKGAKKIKRINPVGEVYWFSEGRMSLTEDLQKPSRTIITSEGGRSAMRTKHLIHTNDIYRRLTPLELERLNMFPDNHTLSSGVNSTKRAFLMGNALVIGLVELIRNSLIE